MKGDPYITCPVCIQVFQELEVDTLEKLMLHILEHHRTLRDQVKRLLTRIQDLEGIPKKDRI